MKKISYGRDAIEQQQIRTEKPIDPEELKERIASRLGDLDALPFVYRKLLSILNSPFASARDLGKVISTDQGLSVRVLRMVNSAYYGVTQRVMSVTQAVSMLGLNVVRSLCFCLASYDSFFAGPGTEQTRLWRRAMGTGLTAKNLAQMAGLRAPDEFLVAGMLHDIGYAVLRKYAPREFESLQHRMKDQELDLELEREVLGTDHTELGEQVCLAWKLPELLIACVRHHHDPQEAGPHAKAATLVALAAEAWDGPDEEGEYPSVYLELLGLSAEEVSTALERAESELEELGNFVGMEAKAS